MIYNINLEHDSLIKVYNGSMARLFKMDGIEHINTDDLFFKKKLLSIVFPFTLLYLVDNNHHRPIYLFIYFRFNQSLINI